VNLWKTPFLLAAGSVGLFALTIIPDALDALGIIHLPVWLTMGGIDDARAILSAMLGCVSTVLALIFSVALLVLSMVATLFGPRLLYRFLQDWVTQVTIGLFMGTFVYLCLVFLVTHQDEHTRFVPQVSLITAWLLVVGSFAFLVFYSHRIAHSIQNPDLIARIVDDIRPEIEVKDTGRGELPSASVVAEQLASGLVVRCTESGYIQEIDHAHLLAEAKSADAVVHVLFRPGQFVLRGERLAVVFPEAKSALAARVEKHVKLGRHRTLKQDPEFGLAQMVEIALRALSPAVNDTFTGVACVDWIGDALLAIAERQGWNGVLFDGEGRARVHVRPVRLDRLVRLAFDQVRQAAADNPAVLIRILEMIRRLTPKAGSAREALLLEADAVRETAKGKVTVALDLQDIDAAWERAKAV
jgi:uncharacterized membrane protein